MSTLQSLSTLQLQNTAIPASFAEAASDDPLLPFAGPFNGCHALVIAPNGLDLMCRLLRQGCWAATTLRLAERPDAKAYDLVLAPQITEAIEIGRLVHHAKRALLPTGRFLAHVPHAAGDPADDIEGLLVRTLRLAGFASVSSTAVADGVVIRADFGPLDWSSAITTRS